MQQCLAQNEAMNMLLVPFGMACRLPWCDLVTIRTGSKTVAPIVERAAFALELREAPTHAHVSSSDRGASKGLSFFTKPGRKVLHTSPA